MKKSFLNLLFVLSTLFCSNIVSSQVPDWIKNALPVKEKHLKKIDKKGDEYLDKYKSFPENSVERRVYYRIKYIDYLKRMETLNNEISKVTDSIKPFPFPLFVSPEKKADISTFNGDRKTTRIKNDTLLYVVDLLEGYSKIMPIQKDDYSSNSYKIIIEDKSNKQFVLEYAYNNYELAEYPHFNKWKEKYLLYAYKEAQKIRQTEKKQQEAELKIKKERDSVQEDINKELKTLILCNTSTDDFTGLKTIETNQKRLIVIENESVKEMYPNEDYEMFVCAFKAIKTGNKRVLDVYLKFKTDHPLDFYGIIEKGALIEFKLENNKIIKLPFTNTVTPTIRTKYKYSYYENGLSVSEKDITEFLASNVKKIRIHFSKGYKDYDVEKENGNLFIKQINCIK